MLNHTKMYYDEINNLSASSFIALVDSRFSGTKYWCRIFGFCLLSLYASNNRYIANNHMLISLMLTMLLMISIIFITLMLLKMRMSRI